MVKTLVSIRFKVHKVNENNEFLPPATLDKNEVICLNEEMTEEKIKEKIEELKKCLQ